MCPPTTPDRNRAKNRTSAAPFTVSNALKTTESTASNAAFFKTSTDSISYATNSSIYSSSATSITTNGKSKRVLLTFPTMMLILLTSSTFSFFIGCYVRYSRHLDEVTLATSTNDGTVSITGASIPRSVFVDVLENAVPVSWTYDVETVEKNTGTRYSFQNFVGTQLGNTVVSSNTVLLKPDGSLSYVAQEQPSKDKKDTYSRPRDIAEDESTNYEPSGQHILVDIENVDINFLMSEERLTRAMMELIQNRTKMTLLSYHCHSNVHKSVMGGISCAGILLESHVSFHTFPIFGIISFDLFSCGKSSLVSVLPDIRALFAIATPITSILDDFENLSADYLGEDSLHRRNGTNKKVSEPPIVKWTYKRRGFRNNYNVTSSVTKSVSVAEELPDFHWMLSMGNLDKAHVTTVQTDFQRIDIFDMKRFHTRPSEEVDRVVYLDGIIQSRFIGEHAYHEALVHPVMICHDSPKRVIIIGGGEGATLREVLKHNTVEEVIMVEIDEVMVLTSQMYLPEWSTCDNGISCFDDPRATTYFTDAIAWFINRFGENSTIYDEKDVFDVIIMDALYALQRIFLHCDISNHT
jgi:S-adenosylmethionine/arginine decarboxylase-like enzyme